MVSCDNLPDGASILAGLGIGLPPINPNYFDDPTLPRPAFTIEIFRDGVAWDFSKWYASINTPRGDMYIEDNRGAQRGRASFTIIDFRKDVSTIPFKPIPNLKMLIWNQNKTDLLFSGSTWSVEPTILGRRCDGSAIKSYKIEGVDLTIELERTLVVEIYVGKTIGFIVKDIIRRFTCLDATNIDATKGQVLDALHVNGEYPSELIQRLIDLEGDWTIWIDYLTSEVYIGPNADILNVAPLVINEANVYDLFDYRSISFSADARGLRNSFVMWYNQAYTRGTVNVANTATVVFGTSTEWLDATNIENGATIRFNDLNGNPDEEEYTVDHVNNNGELILTSAYTGSTKTNVTYEIYGKGMRRAVTKSDATSIGQLKILRGEQNKINGGIFAGRITDDRNRFTREEAISILNSHLLEWTNPLLAGGLKTNNSLLPTQGIRAGQVVDINLPETCGTVANGVLQRVIRRDISPILCRTDGRIDPLVEIEMEFTERSFDIREQIKKLMANVEKTVVNDTGKVIEIVKAMFEQFLIQDCMDIVDPTIITENINIEDVVFEVPPLVVTETFDISDDVTATQIFQTAPFYTTPTGNQAGYCIGRTKFGAVS